MPPPTASLKPTKPAAKDASASIAPAASDPTGSTTANGSDEKRALTKPDQAQYNAEQDETNKEIAAIKTKLVGNQSRYT